MMCQHVTCACASPPVTTSPCFVMKQQPHQKGDTSHCQGRAIANAGMAALRRARWLARVTPNPKVVFAGWKGGYYLVHCCVLQISCIQDTALYPASCRTLSFSQFQPWMSIPVASVEHVLLFKVQYSQNKWHTESLSRAEHASLQTVSGSFCGSYALVLACSASCHASLVFPQGEGGGEGARQAMDGLWAEVCGQQKQSNDPGNNQHILNTPIIGRR